MRRPCPLCERDAAAREVHHAFLEAIDEERDRIDYVRLKRSLEAEFDLDLTVSGVQAHFDEHLVYVWNPIEPAVDNDPAYRGGRRR